MSSFKILFYIYSFYILFTYILCGVCACVWARAHVWRSQVESGVFLNCIPPYFFRQVLLMSLTHRFHRPASPSDHLDLSFQCWDYGLEPPCPVLLHGYWGSEHGSSCLQSTSPTKPFPQPLYQVPKEQEMFPPLRKLFHDQLNYDIIRLFLCNYLFQSKPQPVCPCMHSN